MDLFRRHYNNTIQHVKIDNLGAQQYAKVLYVDVPRLIPGRLILVWVF